MNVTKIIILKHIYAPTSKHLIKKKLALKKHGYEILKCNM